MKQFPIWQWIYLYNMLYLGKLFSSLYLFLALEYNNTLPTHDLRCCNKQNMIKKYFYDVSLVFTLS